MNFKNLEHFKQIAEAIPQLVWTCLPDGACDYLSRQWEEYTGIPMSPQLGFNWLESVIHSDDRKRTLDHWMGAVAGLHPYDIEYRIRRHDGEFRWFKTRGTPIKNKEGLITYWFGTCTDVHEQKVTSDRLKNFWNLPANLLAIANAETSMLEELSPSWEATLGYTNDELTSQSWLKFVHPDDLELTIAEGRKLKDGKSTINFENRYRKKDGSYIWLSWIATPVNGKLYCRVQDINDRKLAEKLYQVYAEAMPQMAFIADTSGNIIYFNKRHYDYVGLTAEEQEGWKWRQHNIHHPEDLEQTLKRWTHALKTGEPYETEYRLRRYDGVYRWHLARALPIRNERGEITAWFGTNTDIQEVKELNNQLQEAVIARDEFISVASHELKTPLASMKLRNQLQTRLIQRKDPRGLDPDKILLLAEDNDRQIRRLTRLVEDMLEASKISLKRVHLQLEEINLGHLLREVIQYFWHEFDVVGVSLPKIVINEDLVGHWDRLRLEQIIQNLVLNSLKYGEKSPMLITITKDQDKARLSIEDRGPGISPEMRQRIFSRFERGVDANEVSGLGLGLFISRQLAQVMGGDLILDENYVEGARFVLTLPT